jgi:urea carboxylase-associated protein 1
MEPAMSSATSDPFLLDLPGPVLRDHIIPARAPWSHPVLRGQTLRIVDLEGNQAVDFLVYNLHDPSERYSACETIAAQQNIFLNTGTRLMSSEGRAMMTITADNCGRHDTSGGACSVESNSLRYGHHTRCQHACVDNFLTALIPHRMGKRDMVSNINWFMNVPVEPDGSLGIVDGISAPGKRVDLRADMDCLVVVSNCPQINNPCNGFNPTPVRMIITAPA